MRPSKKDNGTSPRNRRADLAAVELPPELDRERALDVVQTGSVTGFAPITLAQMRARGDGPPFIKIGRSIRYRVGDILDWRAAHTVGKRGDGR